MEIVGIFCIFQGKLLYLLRQEWKAEGNKWCDPGGRVDPTDKNPKQAMIRELEEETGIKVRDIQFVKTYFERYPDMDFTYHKYKVVLDELPIITLNPDEHSNYAWFTPQEALEHTLITGEDEIIRDIFNIE